LISISWVSLLVTFGAEPDRHPDERDREAQAAAGAPGGECVEDKVDRAHPQVAAFVRCGDVRLLDGELDRRDNVLHGDAVGCHFQCCS